MDVLYLISGGEFGSMCGKGGLWNGWVLTGGDYCVYSMELTYW